MFSALYLEGMFRPVGTIKEFLDFLVGHFRELGGELRLRAPVAGFGIEGERVARVVLDSGEEIGAGQVISTAGYPATLNFAGAADPVEVASHQGRMSFVEIINVLPAAVRDELRHADNTIIFFNFDEPFDYRCPDEAVNLNCGVICFPDNFHDLPKREEMQLRVTHPANYRIWRGYSPADYRLQKGLWAERSAAKVAEIVGNYRPKVLYQDVFTPLTVERFTGKAAGAIYGSPVKLRDGRTPWRNLFVAGTDQGYLGIVGAMLSGVTMVNQHIFSETHK
jgi:phytoene dehydrogenase-like protein